MYGLAQDDTLTEEGANALAAKIRAFWKKRNKHPEVWVMKVLDAAGCFVYVVRSDIAVVKRGRP